MAAIDPASGVYPATPMGVLSVMRETVENARRRQANRTAYDRAAEGAARPRFDPILDAIEALLDGDRQLVFVADDWLDGFRALRASDEMRLRPVLAGVPDAAPLLDRLPHVRDAPCSRRSRSPTPSRPTAPRSPSRSRRPRPAPSRS